MSAWWPLPMRGQGLRWTGKAEYPNNLFIHQKLLRCRVNHGFRHMNSDKLSRSFFLKQVLFLDVAVTAVKIWSCLNPNYHSQVNPSNACTNPWNPFYVLNLKFMIESMSSAWTKLVLKYISFQIDSRFADEHFYANLGDVKYTVIIT
jgi:hypothetical protein